MSDVLRAQRVSSCGCCRVEDNFRITCTDPDNVRQLPPLTVPIFKARGYLCLEGFVRPEVLARMQQVIQEPLHEAYSRKGIEVDHCVADEERSDRLVPKGRHKIYAPLTHEVHAIFKEALNPAAWVAGALYDHVVRNYDPSTDYFAASSCPYEVKGLDPTRCPVLEVLLAQPGCEEQAPHWDYWDNYFVNIAGEAVAFQPTERFGLSFYLNDVGEDGGPIELWPLTQNLFDEHVFGEDAGTNHDKEEIFQGWSKWRWNTYGKNDAKTHNPRLDALNQALCELLPSEKVTGKAGTIVFRTYHIWHRGTSNQSCKDRLLYTLAFEPYDARKWIREHMLFGSSSEDFSPVTVDLCNILRLALLWRRPGVFCSAIVYRLLRTFTHESKLNMHARLMSEQLRVHVGMEKNHGGLGFGFNGLNLWSKTALYNWEQKTGLVHTP